MVIAKPVVCDAPLQGKPMTPEKPPEWLDNMEAPEKPTTEDDARALEMRLQYATSCVLNVFSSNIGSSKLAHMCVAAGSDLSYNDEGTSPLNSLPRSLPRLVL